MGLFTDIAHLYAERPRFFLDLLWQHIGISATAVILSAIIGITLGILLTRIPFLATPVLQATNILYTIPSIALFGILVTVSGIGNTSAIIALVIYGLLPIIRNTYVGIQEVDPIITESALAMGSTRRQLLWQVQLPLAMPIIFAGFRTMTIMTISLTGIASFIGAGGLGVAIWRGISTNYPAMTMGASLLVALLAIVTDALLGLINRRLTSATDARFFTHHHPSG